MEIRYRFLLPDGRAEDLVVALGASRPGPQLGPEPAPPPWVRLGHAQCPHCPLDPAEHPVCPAAAALASLVALCGRLASHQVLRVEVTTPERVVSGETTAQRGVSSLMGLLLATSGCPFTQPFRPMARFHLPLASEEETLFRAASSYLLGQYFRSQAGEAADLRLEGLLRVYVDVQVVNRSLAERLRSAAEEDAAVNALVLLDLLARALPHAIEESMAELRHLYLPLPSAGR